jgi:hypothetical protein
MDFTGKPHKGFLLINEAGYRIAVGLAGWLDEAVACATAMPPLPCNLKMYRLRPTL